MNQEDKSLRSPLSRARGLGSAKEGVHHWRLQRFTALALVPLTFYLMGSFFSAAVFGTGYASTVAWLQSPLAAAATILFLAAGCHHAASGAREVIEDYVHCDAVKLAGIIAVKFAAALLAVLGILAVAKIYISGMPHA